MSPRGVGRALALHLRRRREPLAAAAFFALTVAVFYREIWGGERGLGWDLVESYWADLAFVANEFAHGNFPLWNPYERGGYPAHADPQPAVFSPVQWLFAAWGALRGHTSWLLIQVKELSHHALAGTTTYLFLRTRRLPWQAALVGGLAVVTSDAWFLLKSNLFLQTLAWAPLVWMAIDALLARPTPLRAAGLAAALYLPASSGSPPGYFYTLLLAGGYGAFRLLQTLLRGPAGSRAPLAPGGDRGAERPRGSWWARLSPRARLAGALALAGLLAGATQLVLFVPARELVRMSLRAAPTVAFAVDAHCPVDTMLTSIVAPLEIHYVVYCGALTVVSAAVALVAAPGRDRWAPLFFAAFAAFVLALAAGPRTPLLPWLVTHVPGFGLFRVSCRYSVLFPLLFGPLAAYGVAALLDPRARSGAARLKVALALAALVALALALARGKLPLAKLALIGRPGQAGVILAALCAISLLWLPRRLSAALAGLAAAGFGLVTIETQLRSDGFFPRPEDEGDRARLAGLAGLDRYRIFDEFLLEQRAGSRLRLREFRGYTSADPLARGDYQHLIWSLGQAESLALLPELNIRYVLYGPHSARGWGRRTLAGEPSVVAPRHFRRIAPGVHEALHPAPWVAWYGAVVRVPSDQVTERLRRIRGPDGLRRAAVLAMDTPLDARLAPLAEPGRQGPPAVEGKVTRFSTEAVDVEITAPETGLVVLNEVMHPGWRVRVDGQEAEPVQVDLFLRGVVVARGKHRITWRYRPPHWPLLFGLWCAGMIVIVALAVLARARRPRSAPSFHRRTPS